MWAYMVGGVAADRHLGSVLAKKDIGLLYSTVKENSKLFEIPDIALDVAVVIRQYVIHHHTVAFHIAMAWIEKLSRTTYNIYISKLMECLTLVRRKVASGCIMLWCNTMEFLRIPLRISALDY
eukprot:m.133709 g.133709  ORF g.133709 m.133709 type:complete len:123 (+) comp13947_c0_seq2:529-897(+)